MRSCTSSSDAGPIGYPAAGPGAAERAPNGPWLATWLVAVAVAAGALWVLESFWRGQGHRPSTVDDKDLWAVHRGFVYGNADEAVTLVGQSRLQLGFDTAEFYRCFPGVRLANLAVEGRPPLATLRDLAADEDFRGTVLCSAFALIFERVEREHQAEYVKHYREKTTSNQLLNRRIASLVQGSFVVAHPSVRLQRVGLDLLLRRPLPRPVYVVTNADRSKSADYSLLHLESHRARRIARRTAAYRERAIPSPDAWAEQVADVVPWLRRIEARGGRVVFARFPTSGEHWRLDEQYYPRARYWDRLASITGAFTVHFADDPRTAGLECPDTSHLDCRDAPRFTRGLLDVLVERGVLGGPASHAQAPAPGR